MIYNKLAGLAKAKVLIVLLLSAIPFFGFFTYREQKLKEYTGECPPTLDSNLGYNSEKAYALFAKLDGGRALYAWTEITVDMIFPIIYSLFLSLVIVSIFQRCCTNKSLHPLVIVPFIAMLFDFSENILIAFMLFRSSDKFPALAEAASVFTKLKFGFLLLSLVTIAVSLAYLINQSERNAAKTS